MDSTERARRKLHWPFSVVLSLILPLPAVVSAVPIALGPSVVALNGPWKFHTGDDSRWADPSFDDSDWEAVDLTPAAGAHDSDVGLTGYVSGWAARGHAGYWGYAWYRIAISVNDVRKEPLAIAGPPMVDDAYQLFFDGRLLGSAGNFSGPTPVVYSIQPRIFPLPAASAQKGAPEVLAFRVWMSAGTLGEAPDVGGIHIAPVLGERSGIEARYKLQWLETVCGYVVDAILPLMFAILAAMGCTLMAFDRSNSAYLWLSAAMLLTALVRANQVLFFWTQYESIHTFDMARNVVLAPLGLGAWAMAWRAWFGLRRPAWIPKAAGALTLLYAISQLLSRSWLFSGFSRSLGGGWHTVSNGLRLLFLLLLVLVVVEGIRERGREGWFAVPAIVLVSVGLFAQELSVLRVPGIWFPFGTGVSRTQFAYAAFDVVLFALLLRRLLLFSNLRAGAARLR